MDTRVQMVLVMHTQGYKEVDFDVVVNRKDTQVRRVPVPVQAK